MAKVVMGFGAAMIVLGAAGYLGSGMASVTALIPAFFGAAVVGCGAAALKLPKPGLIGGGVFGLLGLGGTLSRLIPAMTSGEYELGMAVISQMVMAVLCAGLVGYAAWWLLKGSRGG